MADEFERIARIAEILGSARAGVEVGIGDDAAVLAPTNERLVVTVDAAVDRVHFRSDWMAWDDVGYRATVAAASDVLAMGATPLAAVAAWTIPGDVDDDTIAAIAAGQREAADALGMSIVGGNIAFAPVLTITTTVFGTSTRPITRSGARPGDAIVLAGAVGEASLGIVALERGRRAVAERAVAAYRRPPILLAASRELARHATAMIDVSDGLAQDLGHLARASGVRAVICPGTWHGDPELDEAARQLGVDPLQLALAGGDDYALVATMRNVPEHLELAVIGRIEEGYGVVLEREPGVYEPAPRGYRHGERT